MLEQWGMPLAVLGLLLATLALASLAHRYQAHQAVVRAAVRQLERALNELSEAMDRVRGVPLSREIRQTLRGEILARLQKIRRLYRRFPNIAERIRAAESAMGAEGAPPASGVGPIEDEAAMRRLCATLDGLATLLQRADLVQPVPADVRAIFIRELGERRAEVVARYYLVAAKKLEKQGDEVKARMRLMTLMKTLRQRGPSTAFVRELYNESEATLAAIGSARREAEAEAENAVALQQA